MFKYRYDLEVSHFSQHFYFEYSIVHQSINLQYKKDLKLDLRASLPIKISFYSNPKCFINTRRFDIY